MKKSKIILKEKSFNDVKGLIYETKDKGSQDICLTMALGYVADLIVSYNLETKEVIQLLKDIIKEQREMGDE